MQRKVTEPRPPSWTTRSTSSAGRCARRRSSTVGLIVPDLENPYFSSLAQQLSRVVLRARHRPAGLQRRRLAGDRGARRAVVPGPPGRRAGDDPRARAAQRAPRSRAAAAVHTIQLDRHVPGTAASLRRGQQPARGCGSCTSTSPRPSTSTRSRWSTWAPSPASSSAHERLDGVRRWFSPEVPTLLGDFSAAWGREAAAQAPGGRVDGRHDRHRRRRHRARRGLAPAPPGPLDPRRLPGDRLRRVGAVALAYPTLTTVRQPVEEMAQSIRSLIESDEEPSSRWFEPELVIGETSPASSPGPE